MHALESKLTSERMPMHAHSFLIRSPESIFVAIVYIRPCTQIQNDWIFT